MYRAIVPIYKKVKTKEGRRKKKQAKIGDAGFYTNRGSSRGGGRKRGQKTRVKLE